MVLGPDGVPYVLDRASKTVYRVDLRAKKATRRRPRRGDGLGQPRSPSRATSPSAARTSWSLDSKNVLWRWRPADNKGKGTLARIRIAESSTWGADILGFGTLRPEPGGRPLQPVRRSIRRSSRSCATRRPRTAAAIPATAIRLPDARRRTSPRSRRCTSTARSTSRTTGIVTRYVGGAGGNWGPGGPAGHAPATGARLPPDRVARRSRRGHDVRATTRAATGSSPSTRATGSTSPSTASPAAARTGPTCARFFVVNRAPGQAPVLYWIDEASRSASTTLQDVSDPPAAGAVGQPVASPAGSAEADRQAQADGEARRRPRPRDAAPPRRRTARGIIRPMAGRLIEMTVESVRVHMLSTQHVVILKDLERERFLPIWIGPWEANAIAMKLQGLDPGATPDARPVRRRPRGAGGDDPRGGDRRPRRRDLPRPDPAGRRRPDPRDRLPARRTPSRSPCGPASGSTRPRRSSTGPASRATRPATTTSPRRRAALGLPRLRELARRGARNRRGARGAAARLGAGRRLPALRRAAPSRRSPRPGAGRAPGSTTSGAGAPQKSFTARQITDGLRAGRRARRPRVVRDADLGHELPGGAQLDQELGREEGAARLDADPLEGAPAGRACRRSRRRGPGGRTRRGWPACRGGRRSSGSAGRPA